MQFHCLRTKMPRERGPGGDHLGVPMDGVWGMLPPGHKREVGAASVLTEHPGHFHLGELIDGDANENPPRPGVRGFSPCQPSKLHSTSIARELAC